MKAPLNFDSYDPHFDEFPRTTAVMYALIILTGLGVSVWWDRSWASLLSSLVLLLTMLSIYHWWVRR